MHKVFSPCNNSPEIDKWVSEGSGWVIDRIDSHYVNVTKYPPLHGSSHTELPTELGNPKKGLINIKNKDDECFRWCHTMDAEL